jgi:hypothetical protein
MMSMARTKDTDSSFLEAALIGYQHQLASVTAKITEIKSRLGVRTPMNVAPLARNGSKRKKHRISAEGRARIAAAQTKRWAAAKRAKSAGA